MIEHLERKIESVDTDHLIELIKDNRIVRARGEMGIGKSTLVLRGFIHKLSDDYRVADVEGHVFGNNAGPTSFANAITHAEGDPSHPLLIIVDSADYLYRNPLPKLSEEGKLQQARQPNSKLQKLRERTKGIIEQMQTVMAQNPDARMLLLIHDENWDYVYRDAPVFDPASGERITQDETSFEMFDRAFGATPLYDIGGFLTPEARRATFPYLFPKEDAEFFDDILTKYADYITHAAENRFKRNPNEDFRALMLFWPRIFAYVIDKYPLLTPLITATRTKHFPEKAFIEIYTAWAMNMYARSPFAPVLLMDTSEKRRKHYGSTRELPAFMLSEPESAFLHNMLASSPEYVSFREGISALEIEKAGILIEQLFLQHPFLRNPDLYRRLRRLMDWSPHIPGAEEEREKIVHEYITELKGMVR